jgi:hypothetical protein
LIFLDEYIKPVSSNNFNVISLLHKQSPMSLNAGKRKCKVHRGRGFVGSFPERTKFTAQFHRSLFPVRLFGRWVCNLRAKSNKEVSKIADSN